MAGVYHGAPWVFAEATHSVHLATSVQAPAHAEPARGKAAMSSFMGNSNYMRILSYREPIRTVYTRMA